MVNLRFRRFCWPPDLVGEVAAADLAGAPIAFSATRGNWQWVRILGFADLRWRDGDDVLDVAPFEGSDSERLRGELETIGIPLYLQASRGYEGVHASAVETQTGVVAFCGISGSGKSTIARVLASRGRRLWADDVVVFEADRQDAVATSLPFSPKLRQATAQFLRGTAGRELANDGELDLAAPWTQQRLSALFVVDAVPTRRVSVTACELDVLNASRAIAALLPHGIRFKPLERAREERLLQAYLDLVATTPVFRVTYRTGFSRFPALIGAIESVIDQLDVRAA